MSFIEHTLGRTLAVTWFVAVAVGFAAETWHLVNASVMVALVILLVFIVVLQTEEAERKRRQTRRSADKS